MTAFYARQKLDRRCMSSSVLDHVRPSVRDQLLPLARWCRHITRAPARCSSSTLISMQTKVNVSEMLSSIRSLDNTQVI